MRAFVLTGAAVCWWLGSVGSQASTRTEVSESRVSEDRFDAIEDLKVESIPVMGEAHEALGEVDEAIKQFMAERGIGAVTLAVSRGGEVIHERAFGWGDAGLKVPLQPGVRMRIASLTKPVVCAAIETLMAEGRLSGDDLVFPLLNLARYEEAKGCDSRWHKVTVRHLLEHRGGWDRDVSGDFTFHSDIPALMKVKVGELKPEHVVRYGLRQKFDFEPGERYAYCNFGSILLVRVIERVSGQSFADYLHATVCKTAGARSFSVSTSDARDRQPGEVWYHYHPEYRRREVPLPFRTEARDGAGALACTAADYCRFLEAYWITGKPRRAGEHYRYAFNGSHPGVTAICGQLAEGLNYVVICNRRGGGRADWNGELRKLVQSEMEKVADELRR